MVVQVLLEVFSASLPTEARMASVRLVLQPMVLTAKEAVGITSPLARRDLNLLMVFSRRPLVDLALADKSLDLLFHRSASSRRCVSPKINRSFVHVNFQRCKVMRQSRS